MENSFGADYITISDEDGTEYELEILSTVEYNGSNYIAVTPATSDHDADYEISILRSEEDNGEPMLCAVEDEKELEAVYSLIMDSLYEEN